MTNEAQKLTPESSEDSFVENIDSGSNDLSGNHEAQVFYIEKKTSVKNTPYYSVGAKILNGPGQGEAVFGAVFKGSSKEEFLRALGHNPEDIGDRLSKDQVIGRKVQITVEADGHEASGEETETRFTIKKFAPLA